MCIHSAILTEATCAICKDWPSFERMKTKYPNLSHDTFLVMTPTQRLRAMQPGVEELPQ